MKSDKPNKAYQFLKDNVGKAVTASEIAEATGWAEATVKTYLSNKWHFFVEKNNDYYINEEILKLGLDDFLCFYHDQSKTRQEYIGRITIDDFLCLKNINLTGLEKTKELYFLGENGDGKTLLLQAILIALKWYFIKDETTKEFYGKILDLFSISDKGINAELTIVDQQKINYKIKKGTYIKNVFSYGVHRQYSVFNPLEPYGFTSLFPDFVSLTHPDEWLKDVYAQELENKQNNEKNNSVPLTTVINLIEELLDNNLEIIVSIKEGVIYKERGTPLAFSLLSEGYKSVLVWVIDLLARLIENQPEVTTITDFVGIVLVDEISLHLHPKWEYSLVKKLRQRFPNIQFIFTTHSPITILGASEDAIFYRLYKQEGVTYISEPYSAKQLQPLMANTIITSPLFDLDTARMRIFDQHETVLDTNDTFMDSRIQAAVEQRIKTLKNEGKIYISVEDIDSLIQQAIDGLTEES